MSLRMRTCVMPTSHFIGNWHFQNLLSYQIRTKPEIQNFRRTSIFKSISFGASLNFEPIKCRGIGLHFDFISALLLNGMSLHKEKLKQLNFIKTDMSRGTFRFWRTGISSEVFSSSWSNYPEVLLFNRCYKGHFHRKLLRKNTCMLQHSSP